MKWEAQPRQAEFLVRTEDEVLYGGAAGGGKTDALLIDLIATCQEHPGAQTLFLRKTFADLNLPLAAIPRSHELLHGRAHWDGQNHRWTFKNRSVLQFGHLQTTNDRFKYQGSQLDRLAWDELTQFTFDEYNYLRSRVRATVPGLRTGIRAATNPGGIGHAWVRERFVDHAVPGLPFTIHDEGQNVSACFIPARVTDNVALLERDPGYPDRLASLGANLARALLEGDWDLFAGQAFPEWRRDRHVVAPYRIEHDWPRWRCIDYGYAAPFACYWLAREPSGQTIVYRELYGPGLLDRDQALQIRALSAGERIRASFADPSMWAARHNGYAIQAPAMSYAEMGVALIPANNDRHYRKQRLHEMLACDETYPPQLQVFSTCVNLIRTLPALPLDLLDPEDVDTDAEDHAYDALTYGLLGISLPVIRKTRATFG